MRHLVDKEHLIYGPYTVKAGKLVHRTQGSQHAEQIWGAETATSRYCFSDRGSVPRPVLANEGGACCHGSAGDKALSYRKRVIL